MSVEITHCCSSAGQEAPFTTNSPLTLNQSNVTSEAPDHLNMFGNVSTTSEWFTLLMDSDLIKLKRKVLSLHDSATLIVHPKTALGDEPAT